MKGMLSSRVRVARRFQRSVRIDLDRGDEALEGFVCPPSAGEALLRMAEQAARAGQGAFTWTGPYGCGKSSLAVALAALLGPVRRREAARSAFGPKVARGIERRLDPQAKGWAVLPVVGSRSDPARAIADALATVDPLSRRCKPGAAIDELLLVAARRARAGLLVVIDEMGKFLEGVAAGSGADIYFFQQLAEAASRSDGRLLVIGVLHQAFDDYASRLGREARDEWLKVQGRFTDIPINVSGEEQIEIVSRAISAPPCPEAGRELALRVAAVVRAQRPTTSARLGESLAACWPLHPTVASLIGPLSRRRFGQNQRSVFGFLNSAEPFGFQDYLSNQPAAAPVPYELPRLWDYLRVNLEPAILSSPDGRRWSLAIDALERCEARGGVKDHQDILKSVALIELLKERSGLVASREALAATLPGISDRRLATCLADLEGWSVLLFRRHAGAFGLYAGSDFDIERAVADARTRLPGVDIGRLRGLANLQPVVAKRHYHETGALRWFDVDIAALAEGVDRVRRFHPEHGATGLFLLLVGTEAETDRQAKRLWLEAAGLACDWPVAVGWTRDSFLIRELAGEWLALSLVRAERAEMQGDEVARREVDARIAGLAAEVEDRLANALDRADWVWRGRGLEDQALRSLNAIASLLADRRYPQRPRVNNELLNRLKPSSNAIAAQKELLKAMVERPGDERLGIEGFPASGGLYDSLLHATGLHGPSSNGGFGFRAPPDRPHRLSPLWEAADGLFDQGGAEGADLGALLARWRSPPYGLRDGLFAVLAVAYLMTRLGSTAVYLDGAFQPRLSSLFVDRLTQDPSSVRLRRVVGSDQGSRLLEQLSAAVARHGVDTGAANPFEVARALVSFVMALPAWTLRTTRLATAAASVRDLAKSASDPNKFVLDDLPAALAAVEPSGGAASDLAGTVGNGLDELVAAYPRMLRELEATTMRELRCDGAEPSELSARASAVVGLTGNYRLDAFATRLAGYGGGAQDIEGLVSLAANKPPKDWVDRDVDAARVELAALAQEFVRAEALAHVKGREDGRVRMSIFISDPARPSPLKPDFDVGTAQRREAATLADGMARLIADAGAPRNVALAALAELGARLVEGGDEAVVAFEPVVRPAARRKGRRS